MFTRFGSRRRLIITRPNKALTPSAPRTGSQPTATTAKIVKMLTIHLPLSTIVWMFLPSSWNYEYPAVLLAATCLALIRSRSTIEEVPRKKAQARVLGRLGVIPFCRLVW